MIDEKEGITADRPSTSIIMNDWYVSDYLNYFSAPDFVDAENQVPENFGELDEFCNDKVGLKQCEIYKSYGDCDTSSAFYTRVQDKCAYTCGFCKAPAGLVPFSSVYSQFLSRAINPDVTCDFKGMRFVGGDFYGHMQIKEGSTMEAGTLIF